MSYNEADTRAKLIDPKLHERGWTEDHIKREVSAGAIEVTGKKAKRRKQGRIDYTLRVKVNSDSQPVALALIEAKKEALHPGFGLEQGKQYAETKCNRLNIKFVFSSNGHQFVEYDKFTGLVSDPKPMDEFPTPEELRQRYEAGIGFKLTDERAKPLLTKYTGAKLHGVTIRMPRSVQHLKRLRRAAIARCCLLLPARVKPLLPSTF